MSNSKRHVDEEEEHSGHLYSSASSSPAANNKRARIAERRKGRTAVSEDEDDDDGGDELDGGAEAGDGEGDGQQQEQVEEEEEETGGFALPLAEPVTEEEDLLDNEVEVTAEMPDFQPGSIVRINVKNFVTYTAAEIRPGPSLNMVIGPNGTGKSTLVCAICLGLGHTPTHLGRAKEVSEYVKHGYREAFVEVELQGHPGEVNPVIRRRIQRENNGSTYWLNGEYPNHPRKKGGEGGGGGKGGRGVGGGKEKMNKKGKRGGKGKSGSHLKRPEA